MPELTRVEPHLNAKPLMEETTALSCFPSLSMTKSMVSLTRKLVSALTIAPTTVAIKLITQQYMKFMRPVKKRSR